jgi:thiol-disulfide isomerase/thioredoxin
VKYYEKVGKNEVMVHLTEHYILPAVGENNAAIKTIKEKDAVLKKIMVGQPAPEIAISSSGDLQKLSDIKARYTLLLFWESDCPHCQKLTAELLEFYHENKSKDFEVVAMALDTSQVNWLNYIVANNFDWLNYALPKGWESDAVKAYNIIATPSMFLLDKDKKIIAKPSTVSELKAFIFSK